MRERVTEFLDTVLPRMHAADTALHDGDASARIGMWSQREPVTLLGAAFTATRWDEVRAVFDALGDRFSECRSFEIEVLAADVADDLGYVVAIERTTAAVGEHDPIAYALRVTTIFRREDDDWRVVHRHGDPYDEGAAAISAQLRNDGGPSRQ